MAAEAVSGTVPPASHSGFARLKDGAMRLLARINEHRVMLIAAGVTYYLLLALVPTLTLFVALYGLFNDRATVASHVDMLAGIVPSGGLDIVRDQLSRLTSTPQGALSLTVIVSLVIALWSASSGLKALFDAMNIAYEREEKRNFFVLNGLALLFTLGGVIAALVMVAAVVVIPALLNVFYLGKGYEWLVTLLGYAVMLAVLVGAVGALYRWGPSHHKGKRHWRSPGTLLTVVLTVVVSVLFSWYAANFGNYNAAYGSLGALVGLLTWLWLTMIVVIVGAELNAEAEHDTEAPVVAAVAPSRPARREPSLVATLLMLLPALILAGAGRDKPRRHAR